MKRLVFQGLLALTLVFLWACGGDSDSESARSVRATDATRPQPAPAETARPTPEPQPLAMLSGSVVDTDGNPVAGATLTVLADGPVARSTADENGDFALQVFPGAYFLHLGPTSGFWGDLQRVSVPAEGLTDYDDFEFLADSDVVDVAEHLQLPVAPSRGIFQVAFEDHLGGESVRISAQGNPPFTFSAEGEPELREDFKLLSDDEGELIYTNLPVGSVSATVSGGFSTSCKADYGGSYPLLAKTVTHSVIRCTER